MAKGVRGKVNKVSEIIIDTNKNIVTFYRDRNRKETKYIPTKTSMERLFDIMCQNIDNGIALGNYLMGVYFYETKQNDI